MVPEINRNRKSDHKAEMGILVGYDSVGYRVLLNNIVIRARHEDIVSKNTNLFCFRANDDDKNYNVKK